MKMKSHKYRSFFSSVPLSGFFVLMLAKFVRVSSGKSLVIKGDRVTKRLPVILAEGEVGSAGSVSPNCRCGFVTGEHY